jgi:uncharacterized protein YbbC (DUF1343 family)
VEFTPTASNLKGKKLQGVGIEITDRDAYSATRLGVELALALGRLYPGRINWEMARGLIGSDAVVAVFATRKGLSQERETTEALRAADAGIARFAATREKYLLYR